MSELCLVPASSYIWRKGTLMSLWEFDEAVENETVIPRLGVEYYRDCYTEIVDEKEIEAIRGDSISWGRIMTGPYLWYDHERETPDGHPRVIRLETDVIILQVSVVGISNDPTYSCGLGWEVDVAGRDYVFGLNYNQEVPTGYYRDLADMMFEKIGDEHDGCHILTLWRYNSWKKPDTWWGEYNSEWELIGQIKSEHLALVAEKLKELEETGKIQQ